MKGHSFTCHLSTVKNKCITYTFIFRTLQGFNPGYIATVAANRAPARLPHRPRGPGVRVAGAMQAVTKQDAPA